MDSISFQIPASFEDLRIATKALRNLLTLYEVDSKITDNCELVLQELLANIVEHSYNSDKSKTINIKLQVKGKQFIIETIDTGIPANIKLENISIPNLPDLQVGGYGMAIAQALIDDIQYQFEGNKNMWKLTKNV